VSIEVDSSLAESQDTWVKPRIAFFRTREGIQFIAPNIATGQIIWKGKKKHVTESLGFLSGFEPSVFIV